MERPELNWTIPEIVNFSTGPSTCTPTWSPTSRCFFEEVSLSITIAWLPCGHEPETRLNGLNLEAPFAIEKPRFGAPPSPNWMTFPLSSISSVESLSTLPSASATPGSARTFGRRLSLSVGAASPVWSPMSNADLPLMTALDPLRASVKILSNAWSIEFVSTNVPLIIATPRTIAIAVSAVRNLRLSSPLIANLVTRWTSRGRELFHHLIDRVRVALAELPHDRTVVEEQHAMRDRCRAGVVRHHDDRLTVVVDRASQELQDLAAGGRVEVARRLVG